MAKKPHKYAGSHLEATTTLPPERVAEMTKVVGEATRKVRFEGATPGFTHFSIRHLGGMVEWLTFDVSITEHGDGSRVRTGIGRYMTSQPTFLAIPVGPKEMLGYKFYRKFMNSLGSAILGQDAQAQYSVAELTAG